MLRVLLIGYGKMGQAIERLAPSMGVEIVGALGRHDSLNPQALRESEVCIDFTHPDEIVETAKEVIALGKPLVVGTTGWLGRLGELEKCVEEHSGSLLYGENFSVGMAIYKTVLWQVAKIMNGFPEYDVSLSEVHHRHKVDLPSGTACVLAQGLVERLKRKDKVSVGSQKNPSELQVSAMRCGRVPGTHTALFDSEVDSVTLTHTAHNRDGFALGALRAALWIRGRKGVWHFEQMIENEVMSWR